MKHRNQILWAVLSALLAVLLPSAFAAAAAGDAPAPERVIVLYEDAADPAELEAAITRVEGAELLWSYDTFLSGAAVDAAPQALEQLRSLAGVADVRPVRRYEAPLSSKKDDAVPSDESWELMGADKLWREGCTGDGTVIAVLDTGLRTGHEAFSDDSLMSAPAISQADVEAFAAGGGSAGRYVSRRIPFAYDYYDRDDNVSTSNNHGTHVTALAAGYVLKEDGSVRFRGGAPAAQILSMKIFPNNSGGGSDDSIVLRALEDAWKLGADVVNISIATGAGFVRDQALDGAYCGAFARMAEAGVIICCAAGNENTASAEKSWLPQLPTAAYTDYGTNCAPASYLGSIAVGAASVSEHTGRAVPADYTSWGPASGLHLTPALLAFGGPIVSAGASGDTLYRSDVGTSMASPSAAGLFASLLQALRERGVTDRAQAGRLARSLLECTAQVLEADGLPASPRKQGAGLIDLSAAASSDLVILEPLVEPGESADGKFTVSLTLRNLGDRAITASLGVTALTDNYEKRGDTYYSTLTPLDITGGVTVDGGGPVTVPAGGEAAASLTLTVSEDLRQKLSAVFTNGFYVEGYITASGGNRPVHAAFLGYCGDWEAAPVLEPLDFRDVQDAWLRMAEKSAPYGDRVEQPANYLPELRADMGTNLAFISESESGKPEDGRLLGVNGHAYALHDDARFAMPSRDTDAGTTSGDWLRLELYAQRNAAGIVMLVSNRETGALYYADDATWTERSILDSQGANMLSAASFAWNGTDASGRPLPGGTEVRVDVYAWLDTDEDAVAAYGRNVLQGKPGEYGWLLGEAFAAYRELSFPLTLDGKAPTVSAAFSAGRLTLTPRDDRYLAYAAVSDSRRTPLGEEAFFPKAAGESGAITVDLSDGAYPEAVYVRLEDYAGNAVGYALDIEALAAGEQAAPERCALLLTGDGDLAAWYHGAVDYVLEKGIMETDGKMNFRPEEKATRAEVVKALYQASGSPAPKLAAADLPFRDVSRRASYADAVCWAYENGLVTGQTETTFVGTGEVSRQQLAVILWRCARLNGTLGTVSGSLAAFPDRDSVADWAGEAMAWAVGQGLINGEDGKLNPEGPVTRAQTAALLTRFLGV